MLRPAPARRAPLAPTLALALALLLAAPPSAAQARFRQTNLVSDVPGLAALLDPQLVNPWGLASSAGSPLWVSDAGTGVSTIYNGAGVKQGLVVDILLPTGARAEPTGQVFNTAGAFPLGNGSNALFLFATADGTIAGWNGAAGTTALTMVDQTGSAAYTGLGIAGSGATARLYAANFRAGTVDVFDGTFAQILAGAFLDPTLPAGYAPFNVQNVGGTIYVTYAQVDPGTGEELAGPGLGLVDAFDADGVFQRRVIGPGGALDAPWGLALAPAGFGDFGGALLVGNFGDGRINAFDPATGSLLGALLGPSGTPLENEGLWGLRFGNGGNGGDPGVLFFAAGIDDETHGLLGAIAPAAVPEPGTMGLEAAGVGLVLLVAARRRRRG
jgi:uncharacterized protein (TIGR03118 family)